MRLKDDIPALIAYWKDQKCTLAHNEEIFDIFEGNLLEHVLCDLKDQLNEKSYKVASKRVSPINVLKRLIDKLSKIYAKAPVRTIQDGSASDLETLNKYVEAMDINTEFGSLAGANGFFNLFKNTWIEPYLDDEGNPKVRVIPSDRFFVYSNNRVTPTVPTHFVKIMGSYKDESGAERILFYAYTAAEFAAFNDMGEYLPEEMARIGSDGSNPVGALPGVYINRSKHCLMPKPDSDTLSMTKLIPILLTDLNFALMYQCFSIIYTIDVDQTNLVQSPDAMWDLKSDSNSDKSPQVGSIKPTVDSDKALHMLEALFSLWMQTRNIKAGAIGQMTVERAASGISKAIDEMDTSEDRQNQVPYFKKGEQEFWTLVMTKYHPMWSMEPNFKMRGLTFNPKAKVMVAFAEQRPNIDPADAVNIQVLKLTAGIQSKKGALQELYPDWTDQQLEDKLAEIEKESASNQAKLKAQLADGGQAPPTDPNAPQPPNGMPHAPEPKPGLPPKPGMPKPPAKGAA